MGSGKLCHHKGARVHLWLDEESGHSEYPPTLRRPLSSLRGKSLEAARSFLPVHSLSQQIFIVVQGL